ncbi:MAG: hypothetical protein PHS74_07710 [Lachnospiraceae bacterium]|nr:hypothetical protein [Lachnospiraceae bacterium]
MLGRKSGAFSNANLFAILLWNFRWKSRDRKQLTYTLTGYIVNVTDTPLGYNAKYSYERKGKVAG